MPLISIPFFDVGEFDLTILPRVGHDQLIGPLGKAGFADALAGFFAVGFATVLVGGVAGSVAGCSGLSGVPLYFLTGCPFAC